MANRPTAPLPSDYLNDLPQVEAFQDTLSVLPRCD